MSYVVAGLGWGLVILALVGVVYTVGATFALEWFVSRSPAVDLDAYPSATILKPLHGDEPGLRDFLRGFFEQDYPAPVQIVFGVQDASDPALEVARALAREHPAIEVIMVNNDRLHGSNAKVSNLINMEGAIKHPVVVLADSDVRVAPDYLRRVIAPLSRDEIGFVTCAYRGVPTGNAWSALSAMAIDHHFLPSVAFGLRLGLAKPCFGPTIAMRRSVLDQIGGFRSFANHLADDFEIGRAIRALGYGFQTPSLLVGHGCPEQSAAGLIGHELRWARTIKMIDPVSYMGSVICHPLPWALSAMVLMHASPAALATLALVLAARGTLTMRIAHALGRRTSTWMVWPVRDVLSAAVHLGAFFSSSVSWKGRTFTIGRGGMMIPVGSPSPRRSVLRRGPAV